MKAINPSIISGRYTILIPSLLLSFLLYCCDSFVEVDLPKSQLTTKTVFENYHTADAALSDIYASIRDTGILSGMSYGVSNQLACYSDELTWYGTPLSTTESFYSNALLPSNSAITEYWRAAYVQIYAANAILEGSKSSLSLTSANKELLEGEALFIRALLHFYLVNLYGDIPYITTTDYKVNAVVSKLSQSDIYQHIELDLQQAALLLSSPQSNNERVRPGKSAVYSLLARVYLYSQSWTKANSSASVVINDTGLYTLESIQNAFLKDSRETIWQLQPATPGQNTDEAITFILSSTPPLTTSLSNSLMESFAANDLRKKNWIQGISNGDLIWYYPFKYKISNTTPVSMEYPIVMRLAEQYLIRAEARAQQGDLNAAEEDLNHVRRRAGLDSKENLDKQALLDAIQDERRWEFFTEYGHRFFDLKRSGRINQVLSAVKPGWNSNDIFFPIPQSELELNPKLLPQNDGY